MRRMSSRCSSARAVAVLACLALGCGASDGLKSPHAAESAPPPVSPVERYFPLEDGKVYRYDTKDGDVTGMLVAAVRRVDRAHGELRLSNGIKRFVLTADGVSYADGAFLLKLPLDAGASWPGEHGGTTRIVTIAAEVSVPAGRYTSCIRTEETGGRVADARYETTFCPGVGIVLLEVFSGAARGRAELRSYDAPYRFDG
jgi:hypothetical protein